MDGGGGLEDESADADADADSDAMVGGSNVRVIVRVRPLLEHEVQSAHSCSLLHIGDERVRAQSDPATGGAIPSGTISVQAKESVHRFSFDAVLAPHHSQRDVFEAGRVGAMLRALLKGYHGTIFGRGTRRHSHCGQRALQQQRVAVSRGWPRAAAVSFRSFFLSVPGLLILLLFQQLTDKRAAVSAARSTLTS